MIASLRVYRLLCNLTEMQIGPKFGRGHPPKPALSIVEIVGIVVIAPRRRLGRALQELRRVVTGFARGRTLGRIAAELGPQFL
jgi:hypothetical protein